MLCYRCGRHTPDGSANCANCGQPLATKQAPETRARRALEPPAAGPYAVGAQIALRYVVKAYIGQGPAGFVYRVVDPNPRGGGRESELALKVFHPRLLQTSEDKKTLRLAIEQVSKLNHAGVARVFDYGEDGPRIFVSEQLCHGLPLSRIIELRAQQKLFSLAECEPIFSQICTALEYAHQQDVPHGALKPQNVMIQPDDIRLLDFGLMAALPRRPYLSGFGGALALVAPEVQREEKITAAADVFAIASLLREMLTGERRGTNSGRPAPPVLPGARALLDRALHAEPSKRPDVKTFRELLQAAVEEPEAGARTRLLEESGEYSKPSSVIAEEAPPPKRRLTVVPPVNDAPTFSVGGKPVARAKPAPSEPSGPVIINFGARVATAESRSLPMALAIIALGLIAATIVIWARNPALFSVFRPDSGYAAPGLEPPPPSAPAVAPMPTPITQGKDATPKLGAAKETAKEPMGKEMRFGLQSEKPEPAHRTAGGTSCPSGMLFVAAAHVPMGTAPSDEYHNFADRMLTSVDVPGFCIDRYEYPNGAGALPSTNITFAQAKQMCAARGRRLCDENEWEHACQGPQATRFAYGNEFAANTCNVETTDGSARPVQGAGQSPECKSGFGVVDMSGNVAEWTESKLGAGYVVKGGDAGHPDFASRCANRSAMPAHAHSPLVGTRCCSDPDTR